MSGPAALIYKQFVKVTDPRADRGKNHDLLEMIFLALTATICGANSWADVERFANAKRDWFRRYVKLEHGVPSHDTFGRVFARLDTGQFLAAIHGWVDQLAGTLRGQGIAIDGKTLRGSFDRAAGQSALHTITAFATQSRLCLRQMSVDQKSNEIPAVPQLLQLLELAGATVTLDAMHCQVETAQAIVAGGGDYLLTAKGNQETLHRKLLEMFADFGERNYQVPGLRKHTTRERSHGREELRIYYTIKPPKDDVFARWPNLGSVGMVYRERQSGGKQQSETSFFISSHPPRVKHLAGLIRDHWRIENSQHWVLDVTFAEDASRIRRGQAPEITAAFRRLALNIL
ncbi:ISAs1 family transposase, partial [Bremerella cremea]